MAEWSVRALTLVEVVVSVVSVGKEAVTGSVKWIESLKQNEVGYV